MEHKGIIQIGKPEEKSIKNYEFPFVIKYKIRTYVQLFIKRNVTRIKCP